jgi:hypothetical protein
MLRENSPVRDSTGRVAWIAGGRVEHDGDLAPNLRAFAPQPLGGVRPTIGGWFGTGTAYPSAGWGYVFVDATTGDVKRVRWSPGFDIEPIALGPTSTLRRRPRGRGRPDWDWLLAPIPSGPDRVVGADVGLSGSEPIVVGDGLVLHAVLAAEFARRRPEDDGAFPATPRVLLLWRPSTDERSPVALRGVPIPDWGSVSLLSRHPSGALLLQFRTIWKPGYDRSSYRSAYAVVSTPDHAPTVLTPWLPDSFVVVALDGGSLLGVEDERRVVRYGPEPGVRTVVFPAPR